MASRCAGSSRAERPVPDLAEHHAVDAQLSFWKQQSLKSLTSTRCHDGAVVGISSKGSGSWTQISSSNLQTDPYNDPVSTGFGNPLANRQVWCGDPQAYLDSVVDLQS